MWYCHHFPPVQRAWFWSQSYFWQLRCDFWRRRSWTRSGQRLITSLGLIGTKCRPRGGGLSRAVGVVLSPIASSFSASMRGGGGCGLVAWRAATSLRISETSLFQVASAEHWDVANWVLEGARLWHKREWASPNLSSPVPPFLIEWEGTKDEKWAEASDETWGAEPMDERQGEARPACELAREACRFLTKPVQCNQPGGNEDLLTVLLEMGSVYSATGTGAWGLGTMYSFSWISLPFTKLVINAVYSEPISSWVADTASFGFSGGGLDCGGGGRARPTGGGGALRRFPVKERERHRQREKEAKTERERERTYFQNINKHINYHWYDQNIISKQCSFIKMHNYEDIITIIIDNSPVHIQA